MLQTINLTKIYKPKKGIPVKALQEVSITLPQRGMVFLLGKSGSGKSTLLNLLGGLDKYDGGDILVGGESTNRFTQSQFDSYRNTYVGFIFQEYNLLNDFTVGANVALAIELQGKKATDEMVNNILGQVDLTGYANRKPGELSGGQKQRVAIARALVKNPQIIMADEPTGALDSNTGRQVLETLKKLSADKLVLVVSHDREFAENYGDRIIELADGRVISDMECEKNELPELIFEGNTIEVPRGYHITEEDRRQINEYIAALETGATVRLARNRWKPTDIALINSMDQTLRLIRSKLPMRYAFRMGTSGLKHKKIRLIITILLSVTAFIMFGLADTFGAYDHITSCTDSLIDSGVTYASVDKSVWSEEWDTYESTNGLGETDIADIEKATAIKMKGVYASDLLDLSLGNFMGSQSGKGNYDIYPTALSGFSTLTEQDMKQMNYELKAGDLPQSDGEMVITAYTADAFKKNGWLVNGAPVSINTYRDVIGRTLSFGGKEYTVCGVVDTKINIEKYKVLAEETTEDMEASDAVYYFALISELSQVQNFSLHQVGFLTQQELERIQNTVPQFLNLIDGSIDLLDSDDNYYGMMGICTLNQLDPSAIRWFGEPRTSLAKNEIVISSDMVLEEDVSTDEAQEIFANTNFSCHKYDFFEEVDETVKVNVVGMIDVSVHPTMSGVLVCGEELLENMTVMKPEKYSYAVGAMPQKRADVRKLVSFCYNEDAKIRYNMLNAVTFELDLFNEVFVLLSKVFLWIGVAMALFASLMLSNFIAQSIANKKREIGILRAIGSRSADVFRVFFSESFIIAMINFALSSVGVGMVTAAINNAVRNNLGMELTVLTFGARQILLLFVVSLAVAAIGSFLPVQRFASKKPIDVIRQ